MKLSYLSATGSSPLDATPFAKYPTIFTRLERCDPTLKTQSIATWDQIATMAGR